MIVSIFFRSIQSSDGDAVYRAAAEGGSLGCFGDDFCEGGGCMIIVWGGHCWFCYYMENILLVVVVVVVVVVVGLYLVGFFWIPKLSHFLLAE